MSLPMQFCTDLDEKPEVILLVSCSNTKRAAIDRDLRARTLKSVRVDERAEEWISRLVDSDTPSRPAVDLYGGDHWSTARTMADHLERTGSVSLKILSAGYGLLNADTKIKPYSATFSPRSPDLVAHGSERSDWWKLINTSLRIQNSEFRTIADTALQNPSSSFVVVASDQYLRAIAPDLLTAAGLLASPSRLLIFSAGSATIPDLDSHMVNFDSRLRRLVGGSNISLNARVAAHVLRVLAPADLDVTSASAALEQVSAGLDPINRPVRRSLTDEEVLDFIVRDRLSTPSTSASAALRRLRSQGFACEQKRFHNLFKGGP